MRSKTRTSFVSAAAAALVLSSGGLALASSVDTAVVDVTAPVNAVTVDAGGAAAPITINATVTGNQEGTATFEVYQDWVLRDGVFSGSNAKEFTVEPRTGRDAATTFTTQGTVAADAIQGAGTFTLQVGVHDVTNSNTTGAKLAPRNAGSYQVTVDVPTPSNTAPNVSVTGFEDGASFEIGAEPSPGCSVTDAEDTDESAEPDVDRSALSHGLGVVTVTCSYTDDGGVSASDTKSYTVVDTGNPTITHTVTPTAPDGANNWYVTAPTVTFECDDEGGSGIQSCVVDGSDPASDTITLGESSTPQSVSGTATDWAGNTATDAVDGLLVDLNDPTVNLVGGPTDGASYYFGDTPAAPSCEASDSGSGVDGSCAVSDYDTSVGTHTVTATVKDRAGRDASVSARYTVLAWTLDGFYRPVDMGGVVNTVKAGSTVPLKFNVFKGTDRLTSGIGATFSVVPRDCATGAEADSIEFTTTGSTTLRYDSTSQQWIQNWATPRSNAGSCYRVTMKTADGSSISADFKLK